MNAIVTALIVLLGQIAPLVQTSSNVGKIIQALIELLPAIVKVGGDIVQAVKNIIESLKANPATSAEQIQQLEDFNAKVDEKVVKEKLQGLTAADLKNKSKVAEIAKDIMHGKETVLVGRLSKAMGKLGRSLIIDLPTQGYRQVDHRTLKWLIIKNVKYVVSK